MSQKTATYKVGQSEWQKTWNAFVDQGWSQVVDPNPYLVWKLMKDHSTLLLYSSGKLVFQGGESKLSLVNDVMGVGHSTAGNSKNNMGSNPKIDDLDTVKLQGGNYIGCDEAGKGEFYGPLVAAACYATAEQENELVSMGVKDSKMLTDDKIIKLAAKIKALCKYSVRVVMPEEFNTMIAKEKNISIVLSYAHSQAVNELVNEILSQNVGDSTVNVIVDKFSKLELRLKNVMKQVVSRYDTLQITEIEHGEAYPAVAAASILARTAYLEKVAELEAKYDTKLPRGYMFAVSFGKEFVKKFGRDEFEKIAKTSFKTAKAITN